MGVRAKKMTLRNEQGYLRNERVERIQQNGLNHNKRGDKFSTRHFTDEEKARRRAAPDARQGERLRLRLLSLAPIPINSKNHSNIPSAARHLYRANNIIECHGAGGIVVFLLSRASFHSTFVNPRILEVKLRAESRN